MSYAQLKNLIREIVGDQSNLPISGTVTAVNDESCTLKLSSGLEVSDIRLRATIDGNANFLKLTPKVGTKALALSMRGDLSDLVLLRADEIEKLEYSQNGLNILVDSTDGKVKVANNNTSLHTLMGDLCTLLTNFKVNTPSGPSAGLLPDTLNAVTQLQTGLNQILK